jgi:DNA (cytosine-5)-methyltransferase 1
MKAIELFAGAGGAALGLEAAGFEHLALCEWDPDACATLRAAGLGPVVEGDVRDLDAIEAVAGPSCDLLWSSFPCQAFSTAGKRLGAADGRNGWPWSVDAIDHFRPTWFLGENVRGLLMHRGDCTARGGQLGIFGTAPPEDCPGCYFERRVLPDLRERFAFVGWWLLDAADYGVPQHRRRVILWAGPAPVAEPVPTHGPGRALPWVSMGEALGLDGCVYSEGVTGRCVPTPRTAPTGTIKAKGTAYFVGSGMKGPAYLVGNYRGRDGGAVMETHPITEPSRALRHGGGSSVPYLLRQPSPTVSAVGECKGSGAGGHPEKMQRASDALWLATGRRRLTVEECAILQDFPPDHPWQGNNQARYRQCGNAVPVTLARVVGEAVMRAARQE